MKVRVVIDIDDDFDQRGLFSFLGNLEVEPWFDCEILVEPQELDPRPWMELRPPDSPRRSSPSSRF